MKAYHCMTCHCKRVWEEIKTKFKLGLGAADIKCPKPWSWVCKASLQLDTVWASEVMIYRQIGGCLMILVLYTISLIYWPISYVMWLLEDAAILTYPWSRPWLALMIAPPFHLSHPPYTIRQYSLTHYCINYYLSSCTHSSSNLSLFVVPESALHMIKSPIYSYYTYRIVKMYYITLSIASYSTYIICPSD